MKHARLLPPYHLITLPRPMKAKQRHDLATNALARELEGLPDKLKRWANTILTVVLIVAAVALLVRWRLLTAERAREDMLSQLSTAQTQVEMLGQAASPRVSLQYLVQERSTLTSQAKDSLTTVLNNSDDPKLKAQALVTRGDLFWNLANFPPLPGAATQPFLQPEESADQYLSQAADAYQQILSGDTYKQQHDAVIAAHFGLAAIAENHHDWNTAQNQLQQIVDGTDATEPLHALATLRLANLPNLETSLYLSPATQPTNAPALASPVGPPLPTTQPVH